MAKFLKSEKWKKRCAAGIALALSATLSLGILSACGKTPGNQDETEEDPALPTDTQLIKNGDFEFYNEKTKTEQDKRRTFINSPLSWSASAESPSSDSASGVISAEDWAYMSQSTQSLIRPEDRKKTDSDGKEVDAKPGDVELTDARKQYALDGWDKASLYDRLEFYQFYDIDADSGFEKYDDYKYSIDFDDVKYLAEDIKDAADEADKGDKLLLHYETEDEDNGSSVLMIHNRHYTDTEKVSGTSKYYTSSTEVSLPAGTAAKVSVWVKTLNLTHYDKVPVEKRGGAYISVTNKVGSTALDQLQINDIITENNAEANAATNGWQQYTVYIRANTFASTTFQIVLGLGRGTSDDRYEAVDGIALFDDLECTLIESDDFDVAVDGNAAADPAVEPVVPADHLCTLTDKADDRKFYSTDRQSGEFAKNTNYALDLRAEFEKLDLSLTDENFDLTEEVSGNRTYTSADIDKTLGDNRKDASVAENRKSYLQQTSLSELKGVTAATNGYLKNIVDNDFAKFPFGESADIIMMLSTNGAAYTAELAGLDAFNVPANSRRLISFWVKTSSILTGRSGAGATLVDGENKVSISSFDSTTVDKVNVGDTVKDIWDGWVQCYFFVENASDTPKSFTLELTYGPTAIASSTADGYCDGYAAFANFEYYDLTRAQYNYAATGTYAQKTTLTQSSADPSVFDSAAASGNKLENGLARPANYTGALAGSNVLIEGGTTNPTLKDLNATYGIYTGLLSSDYADNYANITADKDGNAYGEGNLLPAWKDFLSKQANGATDGTTWWKNLFGTKGSSANAAYQPLVLLNTSGKDQPSYGFYAKQTSIAANATSKISVRVKVAEGTTAYLYLIDVSGTASEGYNQGLKGSLPTVTYWYDDEGNIVNMDPDAEDFDENGKILYALQENGLYKNAQDENDTKLYANLANFDKDDDGNLVTTGGTPAYYFNAEDSAYYAYREDAGDESYTYSTKVDPLPVEGDFVRYHYSEQPEAVIAVKGTAENKDQWITVSFYVQTGTVAKDYRLELWAGQRDYVAPAEGESAGAAEAAKALFPADGYVFFDRCTTASVSNYADLLSETEETMLAYQDAEDAYPYRDAADAEKLASGYGRYYTFTFYDSPDYLRYDATTDEDGDGNPWRNYKQSNESEQLSYLFCEDADGSVLGTAFPTVSMYLNYAVNDKTVEAAPSLNDETQNDSSSDDNDTTTTTDAGTGNIWLYLASALLAAALLFTIGAVIFRKFWSKRKKSAKVKAPKQRAPKISKKKTAESETVEEPAKEETPAVETPDENDPYNE